jgi:hypothetical protein
MAEPQVMARFVAEVEAAPPPGLAGLVWFRLPTGDDRRAWSLSTWLAVLERKPLKGGLAVQLVAGQSNAPADIRIDNAGNADLPLPLRVRLAPRDAASSGNVCSGDGIVATRSKAMPGDATCAWARPACCAPAAAAHRMAALYRRHAGPRTHTGNGILMTNMKFSAAAPRATGQRSLPAWAA